MSVIIPVYNGQSFIMDAVNSVIKQGYPPLEIIVVDDGSTDRTAEVLSSIRFDIRYLKQDNGGPASARNTGIASARGQIIAFLDADDLWPDNKLKLQLNALSQNNALEMVLGQVQCLKQGQGQGQGQGQARSPSFMPFAKPFFTFLFGAGLFRKGLFEKIGLLDQTLRYSEDVDWFLRAKEKTVTMRTLSNTTLFYRLHGNNMILEKELRNRGMFAMLKKAIDRKQKSKLPDL